MKGVLWPNDDSEALHTCFPFYKLTYFTSVDVFDATEFIKQNGTIGLQLIGHEGCVPFIGEIPVKSLVAVRYTVGTYTSANNSYKSLSLNLLSVTILARA